MADTMTLEQVRAAIRDAPFTSPHTHENAVWADAIQAPRSSSASRPRTYSKGVISSLVAAVSLLRRGGQQAATSDKMFTVMLAD